MFVDSLKEIVGGKPRELLLEASEALDKGNSCIILKAPTGYGKTTLSLAIYNELRKGIDLGISLIHVLPLRSIGDDLYLKSVKTFYGVEPNSPSYKDIGIQHSFSPGSPALGKRFNIVTLDTFLMSFYKLPTFALNKIIRDASLGQYEVPRAFIYSSIIVFDEVHLYFQNPKMSSLFLNCIRALSENKVPVVLTSATIPENAKRAILEEYRGCLIIDREPNDKPLRSIKLNSIDENSVYDKVRELVSGGKSVIIVRNTVKQAVRDFRALSDLSPILIHGRLIEGDRISRVKKLLEDRKLKGGKVVIATQIIEAGVDISGDVLITSACPPESLEQRMGRVARYGGEGEVYVLPPIKDDLDIYGENAKDGYEQFLKLKEGKIKSLQFSVNVASNTRLSTLLSIIEQKSTLTSASSSKILKEVCNLVRDEELISEIPSEVIDRECKRDANGNYICENFVKMFLPLSKRDLPKGQLTFLILDGNKLVPIKNDSSIVEKNCFFNIILDYNGRRVSPIAVLVSGYDNEVGLVG
jgi:CRISPR-associated endonuclease/helicase Cas3